MHEIFLHFLPKVELQLCKGNRNAIESNYCCKPTYKFKKGVF